MILAGWLLALVALFGWRRQYAATRRWRDHAEGWQRTAEGWHLLYDAVLEDMSPSRSASCLSPEDKSVVNGPGAVHAALAKASSK